MKCRNCHKYTEDIIFGYCKKCARKLGARLNIEKLDDQIPRESDPAPGTPGNSVAKELREVRRKINEIIDAVNKLK